MNLVLSFNGNRTKVEKVNPHDSIATDNTDTTTDTQLSNIPQAMKLLPNKLPYMESKAIKQSTEKLTDESYENDHKNLSNLSINENCADSTSSKNVNFVDDIANNTNDNKNSPNSRRHSNPFTTMRRNLFSRKSTNKNKMMNCSNQSLDIGGDGQGNETVIF